MKCIQPGTVTDDDLVAYVVGEASPAIIAHIQACPHCAEASEGYARGEQRLRQVLDRFDCPSPDLMSAYQLDLLPPVERQQVAAHLVLCPRCADERRILQRFLADDFPLVSQPNPLRRIIAALVPPSLQPVLATRGPSDVASVAYRADDLTITLLSELDPWRRRAVLTGLLYCEGDGEDSFAGQAVLTLTGGSALSATTAVDPTGFEFQDVTPGTYNLELALDDRLIVIADLKVG